MSEHCGRDYNSLPNVVSRIVTYFVVAPVCAYYLFSVFLNTEYRLGEVWLGWICLYFVVKGFVLNVSVTWNYWQRRFY